MCRYSTHNSLEIAPHSGECAKNIHGFNVCNSHYSSKFKRKENKSSSSWSILNLWDERGGSFNSLHFQTCSISNHVHSKKIVFALSVTKDLSSSCSQNLHKPEWSYGWILHWDKIYPIIMISWWKRAWALWHYSSQEVEGFRSPKRAPVKGNVAEMV